MAVSVIIPARDAAATLGRTLEAVADQDLDVPFEIVVVDDGSRDRTPQIVEAARGSVSMVRQRQAGPGPARNRGVEVARGEVLAFTDADCFPDRGWLSAGLQALERADLVQGRVLPDPSAPAGPFDRTVAVEGERGLYETANLFVRRSLFERLGGFDDWLGARLGKPLAEDLWLGWRARRAGATTAFCGHALVHHAVFPRPPLGYAAERARLVYFPAIVAKIPELRETLLHRRWFLDERSAAFDLALLGVGAAVRSRSLLPLVATLPYGRLARIRAGPWGRRAPLVVAWDLVADSVGLVSLAIGSVRHRSPLL